MFWLVVLFVILGVILTPFIYWYYLQFKFRALSFLPGPKPKPVMGNDFPSDLTEILPAFAKLTEDYGEIYKIWTGPEFHVFVSDPKFIEQFLSSIEHSSTKGPNYNLFRAWLGDGLLTASGLKWKYMRKLITPSFHFKIIEGFSDIYNSCGDTLVKVLAKEVGKGEFDIFEYMAMLSLDVILESSMGTRINAQESTCNYADSIRVLLSAFSERFFSAWKRHEFAYVRFAETAKNYTECLKSAHNFTDNVIKSRRRRLIEEGNLNGENPTDDFGIRKKVALVDTLLKPKLGLSITDIRDEVETFMFAGHDTTACAISYFLYELSRHPEIQTKLYEEIETVMGDETVVTNAHLNDLTYLDMVVKESARMHPTIPFIERILTEDCVIDGIKFPKDTIIDVFIYFLHHNKNIYEDPHIFDPDRFLPENVAKRSKFAFIPFGSGARNCIGQKFAIHSMKIAVIKVIRAYELLPVPSHKLKQGFCGVLKSFTGVKVQLKHRQ